MQPAQRELPQEDCALDLTTSTRAVKRSMMALQEPPQQDCQWDSIESCLPVKRAKVAQQERPPQDCQLEPTESMQDVKISTTANTAATGAYITHHHRFSVMHAAENMPEFDPDSEFNRTKSATAFISRLRALQKHYNWSDFLLLEAAQQKLRGKAKQWNDGSPDVYATFEAFEADLLAAYPSRSTTADVIEEIFRSKRERNEGLDAFCRRLMIIGRRANLPDADLVQYILKRIDHTRFITSIACNPPSSTTVLLRMIASFVQKL